MKVLFLMLNLSGDINSSNLYLDLAIEFRDNKHDVFIIAPAVNNQKTGIYKERNINVLRVKTLKQKGVKNIFIKGFALFFLPYQYKYACRKYIKELKFDLILMPTPPITLTKLVLYIKKKTNALFYLILRDIYPQGAADIGLVKLQIIYKYLRKLEILTYTKADIIGCMSPGNIDYIKRNNPYLDNAKLTLLPNWQKNNDTSIVNIDVRQKYKMEDKYIVLFGGTIGYAQKVDNIVILAEHYQNNKDIVFFIIGDGVMKQYLKDRVKEKNLNNVIFINMLPREEYLNFVKSSDVGLITIDERFTVPTIPSKTTSYLSLELPILAIIDRHTDYCKIIDEAGAGLWSVGGDDELLFKNFDRLYKDKDFRKECGKRGFDYFKKYLTSEIAYNTIIKQIDNYEHINV